VGLKFAETQAVTNLLLAITYEARQYFVVSFLRIKEMLTSVYASILGLFFAVLSLRVIALRGVSPNSWPPVLLESS